jgi:DedD protein
MNMPQIQTDASLDSELDLKKRSRRRLVGAAALALLAAIVLPMVMDREPRQPTQDVQVKIPSQDGGGFASRVLPTKPTATPLPVPEAEPKAPPTAKQETRQSESVKDAQTPAATTGEKPAAKVADKAPDKRTEKPIEKPAEKAAEKPAPGKAEEAKAMAALSGVAVVSDQWVVQLGAYREAGNIKILLAKLKQMGVPAYTENFESPQGERTRVRAGPFKTREAAEAAKTKIRVIGVDGPVAPK